jgi:hypothetical protein
MKVKQHLIYELNVRRHLLHRLIGKVRVSKTQINNAAEVMIIEKV